MYISYVKYIDLGGKLDNAAFTQVESMAERQLDRFTPNAAHPLKESPEVEMAMKVIIDSMALELGYTSDVQSFSNDGVSVTYTQRKGQTADERKRDLYNQVCAILPRELTCLRVLK